MKNLFDLVIGIMKSERARHHRFLKNFNSGWQVSLRSQGSICQLNDE